MPSPAAIRASLPKQGRLLTFRRTVQVDTWADLRIGLEASARHVASFSVKLLILVGTFAVLSALLWTTKRLRAASGS